jgi:hypothetical protein
MIRYGLPYNSPQNQVNPNFGIPRVVNDVLFFMTCLTLINVIKGSFLFVLVLLGF